MNTRPTKRLIELEITALRKKFLTSTELKFYKLILFAIIIGAIVKKSPKLNVIM